ncbi:MAG: SPOR domain-containing protein [Candidatus Margulisbacteria bacterium]|nr:SPOR domain-containing protein [Candidatus Margulisiibacteriota bacterium]
MAEFDNNIIEDPVDTEEQEMIPEKGSGFLGALKNIVLFVVLVAIIGASFWVSFLLGKRILVPVKNIPDEQIQVDIPEPPPSIAALQDVEELSLDDDAPATTVTTVKKATVRKTISTRTSPVSSGGTKYYKVQAGFFTSKTSALNLASKLRSSGFSTYVRKIGSGWRVQAGAYYMKAHAQNLQRSLKKKGFDSTILYE